MQHDDRVREDIGCVWKVGRGGGEEGEREEGEGGGVGEVVGGKGRKGK